LQSFANAKIMLTPQEMQVAGLVKDGKTSKEIAGILHIAETTVNFHRKNLRRKFSLTSQGANLRSYLLSLS
ncbi:MAG: helix-turn-helix transcriptional regulator, partial [Desulfobacterales bacterium]